MSDDIVKALLDSLTQDQKEDLIKGIMNSNVKESESSEVKNKEETLSSDHHSQVNEDFTVIRNENFNQRSTPVSARKNKWVDTGEDRDPDFDPKKFERIGKTARTRGQAKKVHVDCHVCGRGFQISESLIYGEFTRCNRCTGK